MSSSKRFSPTLYFFLLAGLLLLSGCFGGSSDGPSLFNDDENGETPVAEENIAEETVGEETVEEEDYEGGEFGFRVEDTVCIRQLHGGCVPYDYGRYLGDILGIHFRTSTDWFSNSADDQGISFLPSERENGETDVTQLLVFRSSNPLLKEYQLTEALTIDEGDGEIGEYDAVWSVQKGMLKDQPVKMESVELILDKDYPWSNFTFLLVTEPDNFTKDQAVLKAAVSSILEE